jgi:Ni/Fe-hydrogenase subunit HybB-like protein
VDVLAELGRFVPVTIGAYLVVKIWDMVERGTYVYLDDMTVQSNMFLFEIIVGVIIPLLMFSSKRIRQSEPMIFLAATLFVVFGVMMNRVDVFVTSYTPPFTNYPYIPSLEEILVTVGYIALLMLLYRVFVAVFPVIAIHEE